MRRRVSLLSAVGAALVLGSAMAQAPSGTPVAPSVAPSAVPSGAPSGPPAPGSPHGGAIPSGDDDGAPKIPRDLAMEDTSLAPGTIKTRILDEADRPVAGVTVTLLILRTKVSEGETRSTTTGSTDAAGWVTFQGLPRGTDQSYRVSVVNQAPGQPGYTATYGSPPFNLPLDRGFHIEIHRFPVASSLANLLLAIEGADTIIEVRDDQLEVQQIFDIINVGTTSWALGPGFTLSLPPGTKGLRSPEGMEDHAVIPVEGVGVRWTGAYPPGRTRVAYDYKIPFEGAGDLEFEIAMPDRVMLARVRVPTTRGMTLTVDGFPPTRDELTDIGVKLSSTIKQGTPGAPVAKLHIRITGIPTAGPARAAAAATALGLILIGLYFFSRKTTSVADARALASSQADHRQRCLDDLKELSAARARGDVGPVAYARERSKLVDEIAQTM